MLLSEEKVKVLSKKIDDDVVWGKIIKRPVVAATVELLDNFLIEPAITYSNENLSDKIPDKFHDELNMLVDAYLTDDYSHVVDITGSGITDFINLPWATQDQTEIWITSNVQMLYLFLNNIARQKLLSSEDPDTVED
jgi:hypothetical protein